MNNNRVVVHLLIIAPKCKLESKTVFPQTLFCVQMVQFKNCLAQKKRKEKNQYSGTFHVKWDQASDMNVMDVNENFGPLS